MTGRFDPYNAWLGIPPAESAGRTPNHYRLLGLAPFEANPAVIDSAADRVLLHLSRMATGEYVAESQRLIGEVMAARICLLDPAQKAAYDSGLRSRRSLAADQRWAQPTVAARPLSAALPPPVMPAHATPSRPIPLHATPIPVPPPSATPLQPLPVAPLQSPVLPMAPPTPVAFGAAASEPARRPGPRPKTKSGDDVPAAAINLVKIVLGGLGGMSLALMLVWVFFRADPLGLFQPQGGQVAKGGKKTRTIVVQQPSSRQANGARSVDVSGSPATLPAAEDSANPGSTSTSDPAEGAATRDTSPQPVEPEPGTSDPATNRTVASEPTGSEAAARVTPENRRPAPSSQEQQSKLDELEDVYKTEFESSTRPGTREVFPDFLLATADQLKSDPVARFVLFREAFKRLIAAKRFDEAVEVVDRLESEFVMDPFTLRVHTLSKASEAAKLPTEKLPIVLCSADLAEIALGRQRMSDAAALIRMADGHARNLTDGALKSRIVALRAEIEEAAEQWGPVERARQTLAATGDDPAAAGVDGRYRCLVEGDWQGGLALLARSNDESLAPAARQDTAGPTGGVTAAALGDNWFELAKSNERLRGFYARARYWYAQAETQTTGLDQVRVRQRIEQIEAMKLPERLLARAVAATDETLPSFVEMYSRSATLEPVDLFKFVVRQELLASPWNYDKSSPATAPAIYSDASSANGRVPAHFNPPREYQMSLRVARLISSTSSRTTPSGLPVTGPLVIGLPGPKSQFAVLIDYPLGNEFVSVASVTDAKTLEDNPTLSRHARPLIRTSGISSTIGSMVACQVRRNSVTVLVDGVPACRYEGDLSKLSLPKEWAVNDNRALIVGAQKACYHVTQWRLEPVPREYSTDTAPALPGQGFPPQGFPPQGFPQQGSAPPRGVPPPGFNPQGAPPPVSRTAP